jgi:hypothetical protein
METVEDYTFIPMDRVETIRENTKLRWTLCVPSDPSKPTDEKTYNQVVGTFGVNCIPIWLWDDKNTFMYSEDKFKKYSFIPKPIELRYEKPPIVIPAVPSKKLDANGGMLRTPTTSV